MRCRCCLRGPPYVALDRYGLGLLIGLGLVGLSASFPKKPRKAKLCKATPRNAKQHKVRSHCDSSSVRASFSCITCSHTVMDPSSVPKLARKAWDGHYYTEQQFRNHYGEHYITAWTQAQVSSDVSQSTRHPILSVAKPGPPPIPKTIPQPAGSVSAAPPLSSSPAPLHRLLSLHPLPRHQSTEQRFEALFSKALSVRETYQTTCHHQGSITDTDVTRPLDEPEMKALHNAWMNDTSAWMSEHCLAKYNALIEQGEEINANKEAWKSQGLCSISKGKGKVAKGKDKAKGGMGKDKDDGKCSTGKSADQHGPKQRGQQLKNKGSTRS